MSVNVIASAALILLRIDANLEHSTRSTVDGVWGAGVIPAPGRPTIVLLHGSAATGATWNGVRTQLGSAYELLTPDRVGYGQSARWPKGRPLTIDDEVHHLDNQLGDALQTPIHMVGHSYGGLVAMAFATHRRSVRSLLLIEPVAFLALSVADPRGYARFLIARRHFERLLDERAGRLAAQYFLGFWAGHRAWGRMGESERLRIVDRLEKIRAEWDLALSLKHSASMLERLGPITTLVRGESTRPEMAALVDALHTNMPGSRIRVVKGADHRLPLTHHAELADILRETLR